MRGGEVLFVCNENSVRSPMAEGIFRGLGYGEATSCGLRGGGVHVLTREVLEEEGWECLSGAGALEGVDMGKFGVVVALTREARDELEGMGVKCEYWEAPDPTLGAESIGRGLASFRGLREWLKERIKERFG